MGQLPHSPAMRYNAREETALREATAMGTFSYPLRITGMDGQHSLEVEATVDTGAFLTMLPAGMLRDLGVEPTDSRRFLIADGSTVTMEIGRAWATIDGDSEVTIVAFGGDDAPPLIGAYTLEGLGLAVDPVKQRLVPARLIML